VPVLILTGAVVAIRSQARAQAGGADAKACASNAVNRFQTELRDLSFPMLGIATPPSVTTLAQALAAMRAEITARASMSPFARIMAKYALDRLTAELDGVGLVVGS
jgi:hypothetical protein